MLLIQRKSSGLLTTLMWLAPTFALATSEFKVETQEKPVVVQQVELNDENDGWNDNVDSASYLDQMESEYEQTGDIHDIDSSVPNEPEQARVDSEVADEVSEWVYDPSQLPGEHINFKLKTHKSTHHLLEGRAEADTGKMMFKSRLMPSNEVKFSLSLKQSDLDDIEMDAYFDLAHYTMELDGKDAVLNAQHKELMNIASLHIQAELAEQFMDYGLPEHSFMLIQMLAYWSKAPEGYVYEKRVIDASIE